MMELKSGAELIKFHNWGYRPGFILESRAPPSRAGFCFTLSFVEGLILPRVSAMMGNIWLGKKPIIISQKNP